jgi:hypothetical protein
MAASAATASGTSAPKRVRRMTLVFMPHVNPPHAE